MNTKAKIRTRRIVMDALFAALFVVFAVYVSIKLKTPSIEISPLVSLPILLAALLIGPVDAVAVALVGTFIEQLLSPYGLTPTAPLWMLPAILQAVLFGILVRAFRLPGDRENRNLRGIIILMAAIVAAELLLTAANIGVDYLDGFHISGYYQSDFLVQWALGLPANLLNCLVRTVFSCVLVYLLLPPVQKIFAMRKD